MGIQRNVVQKAPKYEAHVEVDGITLGAHLVGDRVAFRREHGRAIIFITPEEWPAFIELVTQAGEALQEKLDLENRQVTLPWLSPQVETPAEPHTAL